MKRIVLTALLAAALALPAAAKPRNIRGSEQYKTQDVYTVAPFDQLSVSGQLEVEFVQGPEGTYTVSYTGPYNLAEQTYIASREGVLTVSYKEPLNVLGDEHVRVKIAAPDLRRIVVSGAGEVHAHEALDLDELTLVADGKGEIELDNLRARAVSADLSGEGEAGILSLTCEILQVRAIDNSSFDAQRADCDTVVSLANNRADITISGLNGQQIRAESSHASETELKGRVAQASLTARDRSEIDAEGLQADNADVMAGRSAHVGVRVAGTLNAQTEVRGVVEYKGWPQQINRSGKGTVRPNK